VKRFLTKTFFYSGKITEFPVKIPKYIIMADNPLSADLIIVKTEKQVII